MGLVFSIIGLKSEKCGMAIAVIICNGIWVILTIINAIGGDMSATGQHNLVNKLFGH